MGRVTPGPSDVTLSWESHGLWYGRPPVLSRRQRITAVTQEEIVQQQLLTKANATIAELTVKCEAALQEAEVCALCLIVPFLVVPSVIFTTPPPTHPHPK